MAGAKVVLGTGTTSRPVAGLVSAVFLATLALEAYGFASARLLSVKVWTDDAIPRLAHFTAIYLGCAVPLTVFAPRVVPAVALVVATTFGTLAVGPGPLLVIPFMVVSAEALGGMLARRQSDDSLETQVLNVVSAFAVFAFVMAFAVRIPVNYRWVYVLLLSIPLLADPQRLGRRVGQWSRVILPAEVPGWPVRAALVLLLYVVAMHGVAVLRPEISADALAMHLAVPANVAAHHRLTYEPSQFVWAVMPLGADYLYTIANVLAGEAASRLQNFAMFGALLALVFTGLRRWLSTAAAVLFTTCFASTPLAGLVTGSLFVENTQAAMVVGALLAIWRLSEHADLRSLIVAALLAGGALATKVGSTSFIVCLLPFAILAAFHHEAKFGPSRWRYSATAVAVFLVTGLTPYAIAWWKTGNPFFPFMNDKFHSPLLEPVAIRDPRYTQPVTLATPFDLTFHTDRFYEGQAGSLGLQYLLLVPLAVVAAILLRSRAVRSAATVGLVGAFLVMRSLANARYVYPALPLLFFPAAALLSALSTARRMPVFAAVGSALSCTLLGIYFFASSGWYDKSFYLPLTDNARREYVAGAAPNRVLIDYMNDNHPGSPVLTTSTVIAGLHADVYEAQWHQWMNVMELRRAGDLASLRALLDRWGVRYVMAPLAGEELDQASPMLQTFLERCAEPEMVVSGVRLAHIEPTCRTQGEIDAACGRAARAQGIVGSVSLTPDPMTICSESGYGIATVTWTFRGTAAIEIRIDAPNGSLLAASGQDGSAQTGEWTSKGTTFYLQNAAPGTPRTLENSIARATVERVVSRRCR